MLEATGAFIKNPDRARDGEIKPEGHATRPKFLKGRAAKIWEEYAPQLTKLGVLTSIDAHQFATWCSLAAQLEDDPEGLDTSRIAQMSKIASCFGMDPSARAKLCIVSREKETSDPSDKYLQSVNLGPGNQLRQ
jgi:phage terminase small subunit